MEVRNILDEKIIVNKGIFNNIDVIENSLESFKKTFENNYVLRCSIYYLDDGNFIFIENETLEKIFNLKDSLTHITYEELEYISKYKIPKLDDLLGEIKDNFVILFVPDFSKKILKKLLNYIRNFQDKIIIESSNLKVLKFFKKYNFNLSLLVTSENKRLLNSSFNPSLYNLELNLFDKKIIKKLRETKYIIGSFVKNEKTFKSVKDIYDNIILEMYQ